MLQAFELFKEPPTKSNIIGGKGILHWSWHKIIKCYQGTYFIENPKSRCKMQKRAKNKVQLLYKSGGKKVGAGKNR